MRLGLLFLVGCAAPSRYEFAEPHMGTTCRIVLYASGAEEAERLARAGFAELAAVDASMSIYKPESELSRLNRSGEAEVSEPLRTVLGRSLYFARLTDGAFDVTLGRGMTLDGRRVRLAPGSRIDLGGIAKGFACDRALAAIGRPALVEAGGDLALGDPPPGEAGWKIQAPHGLLVLANCGVATSGNSERGIHIFDPRTGKGVVVKAVTVVASDATAADALATAVAVGGREVAEKAGVQTWIQEEFEPLFNGKDLTGWADPSPAWAVRDGMIVCSGKPTGLLRTEKMYENFVLEFEWRHTTADGNAGLFVHSDALPVRGQPFPRAIEVQIMLGDDPNGNWTGHGDIFSIWGATLVPDRAHPKGWPRCLPSEKRVKPAGEWNHYRVESNDGRITLAVNGKVVSGASKCNPRKGYLCLESEGSEVRFRNLRIRELASADPPDVLVAEADRGFRPLDVRPDDHWVMRDWILDYDGKGKDLWTETEFGDIELIADWRFPRKPVETERPEIGQDGNEAGKMKVLDAGDSGIYLRGSSKSQVNIWCWPVGSGEVYGYRTDKSMPAEVRAGVTPKVRADRPLGEWNRFVITMRKDRLTVVLNGTCVLENARLPGVAPRGKIALQHHGDPIQFANLYVRELK